MIAPILVTPTDEHTVEVLTDFRTQIKHATHSQGNPVTILREPKDNPGLIGAIWTLVAQDCPLDSTLSLTVVRLGEELEYTVSI